MRVQSKARPNFRLRQFGFGMMGRVGLWHWDLRKSNDDRRFHPSPQKDIT